MELLKFFLLTIFLNCAYSSEITTSQCEEVKESYLAMGGSSLDVPGTSVLLKGDDLQICPAGFSCCTRDMEIKLAENSRKMFDEEYTSVINPAVELFNTSVMVFHNLFMEVMSNAKAEFDKLFAVAYTDPYAQNKEFFMDLYDAFERYYSGADFSLQLTLNKFFRELFIKLFVMRNGNRNFSSEFLSCVESRMDSLRPFGDDQKQQERNIEQALIASRAFIQGLSIGRNVLLETRKTEPTAACSKAHTKMTFCSHCRGLPTLKPCHNYCLNVMSGCLAYKAALGQSWDAYISAMDSITQKLEGEGSFNLEAVLSPLSDHISTAVMHYTKNSQSINDMVFGNSSLSCATFSNSTIPRTKTRRSITSYFSLPRRTNKKMRIGSQARELRNKLHYLKSLWGISLSAKICQSLNTSKTDMCWNGEDSANYTKGLTEAGIASNSRNPEVNVDPTKKDQIVEAQIEQLNVVTGKIYEALHGNHVNWLNFQAPLPNITNVSSKPGKSVKSSLLESQKKSSLYQQEMGSGHFNDDEDSEGSGSHHISLTVSRVKPGLSRDDNEMSGSGTTPTDDEDTITSITSTSTKVITTTHTHEHLVKTQEPTTPRKHIITTIKSLPAAAPYLTSHTALAYVVAATLAYMWLIL